LFHYLLFCLFVCLFLLILLILYLINEINEASSSLAGRMQFATSSILGPQQQTCREQKNSDEMFQTMPDKSCSAQEEL